MSFLGRKICIVKIGHILPLRYRRVLTLFQIWAISCLTTITRTSQRIACRIVVIGPVRSGCKLRNELKVAQSISIYASLFCCVFGIFASVSMEIPNHNFLVCHRSVDLCVVHNKRLESRRQGGMVSLQNQGTRSTGCFEKMKGKTGSSSPK